MSHSGFLILNKPTCERSTHCVEIVRKKLGKKVKVGHGGTLDSTACGVLVLLIGAATRLSNIVMSLPKCYDTTIQFGAETDTDDASGNITRQASFDKLTTDDIDEMLPAFFGWRMQTPPNVSAVHVDGRRAHELTRSGETVQIAAKPVYFERVLRTSEFSDAGQVSFQIHCQKGTYIRSFGRDLARALDCAGHLCFLQRNFVGPFTLERAIDMAELENMSCDEIYARLLPLDLLCEALPSCRAGDAVDKKLSLGQDVAFSEVSEQQIGNMNNSFSDNILLMTKNYFAVADFVIKDVVMLHPSINLFVGEK